MKNALDIAVQLQPSTGRNPALRHERDWMLRRDTARWIHALYTVADEAELPCRARMTNETKKTSADLLVQAFYHLEPEIGQRILETRAAESFRHLLILTYRDVPIADWSRELHLGLLPDQHFSKVIVPEAETLQSPKRRLHCRSMGSFTRNEMIKLLQLVSQEDKSNPPASLPI